MVKCKDTESIKMYTFIMTNTKIYRLKNLKIRMISKYHDLKSFANYTPYPQTKIGRKVSI